MLHTPPLKTHHDLRYVSLVYKSTQYSTSTTAHFSENIYFSHCFSRKLKVSSIKYHRVKLSRQAQFKHIVWKTMDIMNIILSFSVCLVFEHPLGLFLSVLFWQDLLQPLSRNYSCHYSPDTTQGSALNFLQDPKYI